MPEEKPKRVPLRLTVDPDCEFCEGQGLLTSDVSDGAEVFTHTIDHICRCVEGATE